MSRWIALGGRRRVGGSPAGVDQRGEPRGGRVVEHVPSRSGAVGIADEAVARVVGELGRLGLEMRALRAERVEAREIEVREDLRHQDRRRPLAVRRQLDQLVPAVDARDRLDVDAGGGGEILERMHAAERPQRGDHVLGDLAGVEARRGRRARSGAAPPPGRARGRAARLRRGRRRRRSVARLAAQARRRQPPVAGGARRHRHARLGIGDRRRQAGGEPEPAPVGGEPGEGVDRARHRHRRRAARRHRRVPGRAQRRGVERRRRPAGAVEPDQPLASRRLNQHEGVAAEAAGRRLGEAEQHRRRDRRVDGVAALLQQPHRDLGGQRMRGGAHAAGGIDERPSRLLEIAHHPSRPQPDPAARAALPCGGKCAIASASARETCGGTPG